MNTKYISYGKFTAIGVWAFAGSLSVLANILFLNSVNDSGQILHFSPLVSFGACICSVLFFGASIGRGWRFFFFGLLLAVFFLFTMRSTNLNSTSGEVNVYYVGVRTHIIYLPGFNDKPYCIEQSLAVIRILVPGEQSKFVFFRGVWPGYASTQMVETAFGGLGNCEAK